MHPEAQKARKEPISQNDFANAPFLVIPGQEANVPQPASSNPPGTSVFCLFLGF